MSNPGKLVERWRNAMGSWSDDDPNVLAWPHKDKEPVIADVNGQLRMIHTGIVHPHPVDDKELAEVLDELGEPTVWSLSNESDRMDKEMFEWEPRTETEQ